MTPEPSVPPAATVETTPPPLPTAILADVLRLARRRVRSGERLGMSSLAAKLGVNRVTPYRWVGSRERLLVEVLWSLEVPAAWSTRATHGRGAATPLLLADDTLLAISVSVGVAHAPMHATGRRALYPAADAALYEAKLTGRGSGRGLRRHHLRDHAVRSLPSGRRTGEPQGLMAEVRPIGTGDR